MPKLQTRISVETSERLTVRRKRYSIRAWCEDCRKTSIMTLPSEAAFLACQDVDSIVFLIYTNRLHVRHVREKGLFVCLASLCSQTFEEEITVNEHTAETEFERMEIAANTENCNYIYKE